MMTRRPFSYKDYALRALAQGFIWACGFTLLAYLCGWVR